MLQSHVMRLVVYGTSMIIISELVYHGCRWLKKFYRSIKCTAEISEVLWTNELSESCITKCNESTSKTNHSDMTITKSPVHKCSNIYCGQYNISRLIQLIDGAKYCIDIAMYTFTIYDICDALKRAVKRGVFVRIISDYEMAYSSGSQITSLINLGIPLRCNDNTTLMHHKFCILDSPTRMKMLPKENTGVKNKLKAQSVLISGSLNWTLQGFSKNWENVLITSNKILIEKYSEEFERIWHKLQVNFKK